MDAIVKPPISGADNKTAKYQMTIFDKLRP